MDLGTIGDKLRRRKYTSEEEVRWAVLLGGQHGRGGGTLLLQRR
jgi:hypothetical protein